MLTKRSKSTSPLLEQTDTSLLIGAEKDTSLWWSFWKKKSYKDIIRIVAEM